MPQEDTGIRESLRKAFDVASARKQVSEWNSRAPYTAGDWIVAGMLTSYRAMDAETAAGGIHVLDRLWSTQLRFDRKAEAQLCTAYVQQRHHLSDLLRVLEGMRLEEDASRVYEVSAAVLETFLGATTKAHYSFATKLLHWHAREHLPIMDSNARKAIRDLGRRSELPPDLIPLSAPARDQYCRDYGAWIRFYAELIKALRPKDRDALVSADTQSQPREFAVGNSLLRVLDKVFFLRGKDESR